MVFLPTTIKISFKVRKLLKQLKDGGKMIVPVGDKIVEIIKKEEKAGVPIYKEKNLIGCTFVPLVKG